MMTLPFKYADTEFHVVMHFSYHLRVLHNYKFMSPTIRKRVLGHVCPVMTMFCPGIYLTSKKPSLFTIQIAKDLYMPHTDSKGSDQTVRMRRLIWALAGTTG